MLQMTRRPENAAQSPRKRVLDTFFGTDIYLNGRIYSRRNQLS